MIKFDTVLGIKHEQIGKACNNKPLKMIWQFFQQTHKIRLSELLWTRVGYRKLQTDT